MGSDAPHDAEAPQHPFAPPSITRSAACPYRARTVSRIVSVPPIVHLPVFASTEIDALDEKKGGVPRQPQQPSRDDHVSAEALSAPVVSASSSSAAGTSEEKPQRPARRSETSPAALRVFRWKERRDCAASIAPVSSHTHRSPEESSRTISSRVSSLSAWKRRAVRAGSAVSVVVM